MKRARWKQFVDRLPAGLSQSAAARYLDVKPTTLRYWLLQLGYRFRDGRALSWTETRRRKRMTLFAKDVDWSQPNIAIARQHNVSRERVRQVRKQLNLKKVNGRK